MQAFRSKCTQRRPAGLCQSGRSHGRDAELPGIPPPPRPQRTPSAAGRGWQEAGGRRGASPRALTPPAAGPPRLHFPEETDEEGGGAGSGVHRFPKKKMRLPAARPAPAPARARGRPLGATAPRASPGSRREEGADSRPPAAAASRGPALGSAMGSPPRGPAAPAPRPPGARTPPPRSLPFLSGYRRPDALTPPRERGPEWEEEREEAGGRGGGAPPAPAAPPLASGR